MTKYLANKKISSGFELLKQRNFKQAGRLFGEVLGADLGNKEAEIGLLIADMMDDFPEIALELSEHYTAQRQNGVEKSRRQKDILERIFAVDESANFVAKMREQMREREINRIDGVLWRDFKRLFAGDFKTSFQNLIFSSKIVFVSKEEFYDFIECLIDNGFVDLGLDYIEQARSGAAAEAGGMYDKRLDELIERASKKL